LNANNGYPKQKRMKNLQIFVFILLTMLLFSCGRSDRKQAAERLVLAETIYQQGDTITALAQLDSIRKLYPGAIQTIVTADQQKKKICADILFRKQDELDSTLSMIAKMEKKFDAEKTEFDKYTQYIPKRQNFDRRWNKSFIQFHLDELGNLYMSSNYYGERWLKHTGIRVYDRDIQAKTDSVGLNDPNNHCSDFMDYVWEKVSYRNGKDNGVIQFIADHPDRKLKAVFLGKRYFYIWLEEYDKQAARDALKFSALLKKKLALEKEIKSLQSKIG
jgi:hypothetical protein